MTSIFVVASTLFVAQPAVAAPVYEITARWADGTTTGPVASGDVINSEWRINVNSDLAAPTNEPVDNVTTTITVTNGTIAEFPDVCLIESVDPVSSISEDGRTIVCNIGTVHEGTAAAITVPVIADGETGDLVSMTGEINGVTAQPLPEIPIENPFGMDIRWVGTTTNVVHGPGYADVDFQWTLSVAAGSDPGPDTVTYDIGFAAANGSVTDVAPSACSAFTGNPATGHPWSGGTHPTEQMAPFVDSCTLTKISATGYELTLTGIDYSRLQVPTKDSRGALLPVSEEAVASGQVTFRVNTTTSTGTTLQVVNPPTYTSPSGQTAADDPSNNTSSKTILFAGSFASLFNRTFMNAGGTNWDDGIRVSPGSTIFQQANGTIAPNAGGTTGGVCNVLDTRYVEYERHFDSPGWNVGLTGAVVEYYVGTDATVNPDPANTAYNPGNFDCGIADGGWTTIEPLDKSTVKAMRLTFPIAQNLGKSHGVFIEAVLKSDVPAGQDVWQFGNTLASDVWTGNMASGGGQRFADTPDARYGWTSTYRDILRVVVAVPAVQKAVDRSVVRPGTPANYTLTYSANGAGSIPPTVDGYQLVDTLPLGMSYVAGSASPEPVVTTNGAGQQVLTWTLDGVPTNTPVPLSYQAMPDSTVEPGAVLRNTVTATYQGETRDAAAQVTVTTNGYTQIGKSADTPFIPNVNGDGVGEGSWTVTTRSSDPLPQDFTDTIDILPYNGDGRGTSFSGTYSLTSVDVPAGATVYYTTADPATLTDDPADPANGAANAPSALWSTTYTPDVTAIRVITGTLAPGATTSFTVNIATDGVEGGDLLVNRAQGRAEHTELVMRTSAPISVANYYSASLIKQVQDSEGVWRDANTVEDYPSFSVGDTVRYRILVENTGQGTLTNIVVADDLQPELGGVTIDSLAPGEIETHEFEIVLEAGGLDTVVNTACATADTPADSEIPPTINCDPAGFEVDGDVTHAKELLSAEPIGGGQWRIVYGLEVSSISEHPTTYSLADTLHFTDQVDIASAVVSQSPTGVTLAEPEWNGAENAAIVHNVPMLGSDDAGYASHEYELTVIVDVPLNFEAGSGGLAPTECVVDGDTSGTDTAFNNVSELTEPGDEVELDQACAPIPGFTIDKSVSAGPVPNGDGTWTVTYEVVATNTGNVEEVYTVSDMMTADGDLEVLSGAVTDGPDGVTVNPDWTGMGVAGAPENVIAGDVLLPVGGVHTYEVEVLIGIAEGTVGAPVITECSTEPGEAGGLSNAAELEHNGLTDEAEACITIVPGKPTLDKKIASATPIGDGQWEVVYNLTVGNLGNVATTYDLEDELLFAPQITVDTISVTGPEGVVINDGFDGETDHVIATNASIAGIDDDGYAPHVYTVTVIADVPLQFSEGDLGEDGTGSPACTVPAGGNLIEQGLNNSATLTDEYGDEIVDTDCAGLPSIDVAKAMDGTPVQGAGGNWTVNYTITVTNDGAVTGGYMATDRLRYGTGIEVVNATITAPDGVTPAAGWTGLGAAGATENIIASGIPLEAGATHTYKVQVIAALNTEIADSTAITCPAPGSDQPGGFANTAGVDHNDLTDAAVACATPKWPGDVPPPVVERPEAPKKGGLADTGLTAGPFALGGVIILILGASAVAASKLRRREEASTTL